MNGSLLTLLCQPSKLPGLIPTALAIEIAGTGMMSIVLLPFAYFSNDRDISLLIAIFVVANLFNSADVIECELFASQKGAVIARISFIQSLAISFLTVIAITLKAPLLAIGSLQAFQAIVRAWLLTRVAQAGSAVRQMFSFASINPLTARALIARGIPLLLAGLSVTLYMKSDQVMLQWLKGPGEVGQYAAAVRLAEVLYFMPVLLSQTYLPRVSSGESTQINQANLEELYRYTWLLGIAMMVVTTLILPVCVPLLFGSQYLRASHSVIMLGPASFAVAAGCSTSVWLQLRNLEWIASLRTAVGAICNVVLNFLLIPHHGSVGAALATSISYFVATFAVMLSLDKPIRRNALLQLGPWWAP